MKMLAIDTSNFVMGVAVVEENKVIGEIITNLKKNHSVRVMNAVESLLKDCDIAPSELDRIAVAHGPGSYTGVRIGVTIAKTLAWTLNIPLIGVSSLEALAANGRYFDGYIAPLFDARRQQLYTGLYEWNNERGLVEVESDRLVINKDWAEHLKSYNKPILFIGNDLSMHEEALKEVLSEQAVFAHVQQFNPRPSELAFLGMKKEPQSVHTFVPNYIRLAEAEANWLASQQKG
ncbi:tRNA (adenosine(37)-N6)-threonylcarbamoyltransferase complex dimerization subunit type 1 TsaB [Priestia aryabhattai]|uniref:tRNA (adenosine(37)-N6)-threonylcarbamoyltransferase complex dimerization subunit type 1 TsaB n=1 Tax=Priestia aryabhattai TaxID=412384 RepID=UPI0025A35C2F|nr:tRNA (adenosine(37)-N6)-threonylcarbamoyltransferase complex dimerization subunit type 1 TsaB [Priestia aryabhattai]WJN45163.1 tRNA (adenosine(37)-N6)-threonylcarbamoyltransferase complex dimerization subunit type 1 TsaB [Priestia aryabhattai]